MKACDGIEYTQHISSNCLGSVDDIPSKLRLYDDGEISIYYAPFDSVNESGKVAIIGLTPGFSQVCESYENYTSAISNGISHDQAMKVAKGAASFAGTMRKNLISMLDGIGLPDAIGVNSCEQLFSSRPELLHATSALRYPVFRNGRNYSGNPLPIKHTELRSMVEDILEPELSTVANAVVIPLGKAVTSSLEYLVSKNKLDPSRCLIGFPHPSGANGHRKKQYMQNKDDLSDQVSRLWAA